MSFWMQLKWYYFKIACGLIGYKDCLKAVKETRYKVDGFVNLRPDVTMDLIYKHIGWPHEVIQKYKRHRMSDFRVLVKKTKPYEWAIIVLGALFAAWIIFAACGGTIG